MGPVVGALVGDLVGALVGPLVGPLVVPLVDPLVGRGSLSPALCVTYLLLRRAERMSEHWQSQNLSTSYLQSTVVNAP